MKQKGFINIAIVIGIIILVGIVGYFVLNRSVLPPTSTSPIQTTTPTANQAFIQTPKSPLGNNPRGVRLLSDDKCLTSSDIDIYKWGIRGASKESLIKKGYSESYFDQHFCAIAVEYNGKEENGYARVTYKATFLPYLAWWQHHFPVVINADGQPKLQNGLAVIDSSGENFLASELEVKEIRTLLSPEKLYSTMQVLIGRFDGPIAVDMGPALGKNQLRLYVRAMNKNPNSDNCANTDRIGTIDVETGKGEVSFNGACR